MVHRIVLNGFGSIGRTLLAGTACLSLSETKLNNPTKQSEFNINIADIINYKDNKTLVEAYKKVQRKYYPERDVYKTGE